MLKAVLSGASRALGYMIDAWDLAASYRTKSDECLAQARVASDSMAKMEWLQLGERWQVLADDVSFFTMLGREMTRVKQAPPAPPVDGDEDDREGV